MEKVNSSTDETYIMRWVTLMELDRVIFTIESLHVWINVDAIEDCNGGDSDVLPKSVRHFFTNNF